MNGIPASTHRRTALLPPRGLLLALAAQAPLAAAAWPLRPAWPELAIGGLLLCAGIVLNVWAERLFRRAATGVCPFSPASTLVRHGPYRLFRHPMYLGLVAMSAGVALATGVLANLWSSVAFAIWLHYAYVLPEEDFLRARFGAAFDAYAAAVPRWLLFK